MAATSCTSDTVNELSAFRNLFHLVCPYFTYHAHIANKSKSTESMQIIPKQLSCKKSETLKKAVVKKDVKSKVAAKK